MRNLTKVSDAVIRNEYIRRFTLKSGDKINRSEDVIQHLRSYITDPLREHFIVVFLSTSNCHIATETLFSGTLSSSAVYPRELVRKVLEHGAAALILAHNHPSGNPKPSQDDLRITKRIVKVCELIDVAVHDHILLAGEQSVSFADKGLM